jgi:plastocyanin
MTLRSGIFSKPLRAVCLLLAGQMLGATVSGNIFLSDSRDPEVKKKRDYAGVVVWLEPLDGARFAPAKKRVEMVQKNKTFLPHILAIQTGMTVDFPNLDPIFHNAFSNFEGQIFDIGLYPPGTSKSIRFDKAGVVRVFCNIHPQMSAIIVVVESPFLAVSDEAGSYSISNVDSGRYALHFFHERATPETLQSLARTITVDDSPVELAQVVISEAGYLPVAHKNKYGQDYPPNADRQHIYTNLAR